ncbi:MAG: radical SAM protein [Candidatus Brocadiaceae bacterium]|nr:radical SAM protein [Candidatus Brocadiaceae bacterium]
MKKLFKHLSAFRDVKCLLKGRVPGQLILQYTDICNAKCPQCSMRVEENFFRSKMNIDRAKKIIDFAAENDIRALSFTGGEPLLFFDDVIALLKHAGSAGIKYTRTGTNGFLFMHSDKKDYTSRITRIAEALSETKLYSFWISIDSVDPAMHEKMRGLPGIIAGIEKAIPVFHDYGIYPSVNLGINRNVGGYTIHTPSPLQMYEEFRNAFQRFYRFVLELGFTIMNACYPLSVNHDGHAGLSPVYKATAIDTVVRFNAAEKAVVFQALLDTVREFKDSIRVFSPESALHSLIKQHTRGNGYGYACRGGKDFFFIDAKNADTYPCGYRGAENLGKFWELNVKGMDDKKSCKECDWECFRDPSELFGPFQDLCTRPLHFLKQYYRDKQSVKMWLRDIRYYKACDYFNGRVPPDYEKLSRVAGRRYMNGEDK